MLGKSIKDEEGSDGKSGTAEGFGYIDMNTVFYKDKKTVQVEGRFGNEGGYFSGLSNQKIEGYELHMGNREGESGREDSSFEYEIVDGHIFGTYCHGFFDNIEFTTGLINNIREKKHLAKIEENRKTLSEIKSEEYSKLGSIIRENIDMEKLYSIILE